MMASADLLAFLLPQNDHSKGEVASPPGPTAPTARALQQSLHLAFDQRRLLKVGGRCDDGSVHCPRPIKLCLGCV